MPKKKLKLTDTRDYYKPFNYPWAYDAFQASEQMHWLWTEVPMLEDTKDWRHRLNDGEKDFLAKIFRFFTQGDIDVSGAYINNYLPHFPQPEVRMMLSSFAAREAIHVAAYSHLIETLGMPESTYNEFNEYEEMVEKHDFFQTLHTESMIKLFRTYVQENRDQWNDETKKMIYTTAEKMVELEDKFINLAFGVNQMEGLTPIEVKQYIRYICDRRLIALGMKGIFKVKTNPLPWVDGMLGVTHTNFFENKVVDYAKGALSGDWAEVWGAVS